MDSPGGDRQGTSRGRPLRERVGAVPRAVTTATGDRDAATEETIGALRARVEHLEAALEGLQDAVYRHSQRHERELADLRRLVQPVNMARSLSDDARRRGL